MTTTLYPIRRRRYRCAECGTERMLETNHRGACFTDCTKCRQYIRTGRGIHEREIALPKQTTHEYVSEE